MAEMAEIVVHIIPGWIEHVFCMGIGLYCYSTGTISPDPSPQHPGTYARYIPIVIFNQEYRICHHRHCHHDEMILLVI